MTKDQTYCLRTRHIQQRLSALKIDAYLIAHSVNINYLTGFHGEDAWLLVMAHRAFYLTDGRFTEAARRYLPKSIQVVDIDQSYYKTIAKLLKAKKVKRCGFNEKHLNVFEFKTLQQHRPAGVRLEAVLDEVEVMRLIKDEGEIRLIRQALAIHQALLNNARKWIVPGQSEADLAWKMECFLRKKGVGWSFPPIVASGPNSSYPHAQVTWRKCRKNDVVLVDTGVEVNGYKSDLTRIFFLGKIRQLIQDVYAAVDAARRETIRRIGPGMTCYAADQIARNSLKKNKLEKYFTHSTGHGVGLEIHEAPRLGRQINKILEPGMVVTVEPGVYFPGKFGIRIEDMVLITKKGCECLSDNRN
ncbi:MAG: aminopeptidase P family protein [Candidatus Omnitrophica bacterium]|nr:aminopeptidase P family protein [Candidatus Omnitrophota bacterium]